MNQELSFETIPFEFDPEFQDEEFEEENEKGRMRTYSRQGSGFRSPSMTGKHQKSKPAFSPAPPKKSPVRKPSPSGFRPRGPWGVIREPYGLVSEPYSGEPEPSGSERVRWAQDSLNRILGLRLPVNGIMGPETRSAIRSFQEQQGLPITGLVGPDTEQALISATSGQSPGAGAAKPAESGMTKPSSSAAEFDFEWENFDDGGEPDFPAFESPAEIAQKKLLDFREKIHLRPQDYRNLFARQSELDQVAPRKAPLTAPLSSGCIDVSGRCISVGCAAPYKCVRRLLGGCECRPGKLCPKVPDPASGECLRVLRRDGNYLVCCPKYYGSGDPCCRVYPIPSRLMTATEFEPLSQLEDELEDEALELEPFISRRGLLEFEGPLGGFSEFESPAEIEIAQKKLLAFREKVILHSQDYRKLILAARLHPFPQVSFVIMNYPVTPTDDLFTLIVEAFGFQSVEYDQILDEWKRLANRKFGPEVAAEEKLVAEAAKALAYDLKNNLKEIKPILLEAAMLDPKKLKTTPGALSLRFYELAARLAVRLFMRSIIESEASEAHLVRLGWRFAEYASNLQKKDRAFKNEVDQERRRRRLLQQQQKRKRR